MIARMSGASPHASEAAAKTSVPAMKMRLRPRRSPSEPPTSTREDRKREYDSTIHCAPATEAPRSCWRTGSATLTTMPSMNAMLEPRIVAVRTQRAAAGLQGRSCCCRMTASSHGGEAALAIVRLFHEAGTPERQPRRFAKGTTIAQFISDLAIVRGRFGTPRGGHTRGVPNLVNPARSLPRAIRRRRVVRPRSERNGPVDPVRKRRVDEDLHEAAREKRRTRVEERRMPVGGAIVLRVTVRTVSSGKGVRGRRPEEESGAHECESREERSVFLPH